jgi:hypothetical protein
METRRSLLESLLEPERSSPSDPLSRLAGFADGFWAARYHLGAADPIAEEFFHGLDHERGEKSTAGWWTKLSHECGGDQVAAAQKLRELITEFLRRERGARTSIKGTLFEFLADMRRWLGQDFNPGLPERKLARLAGYIDGYLAARIQLGVPDVLANEFFSWLRERGEHPPEGWEAKLLRDFKGDEVAAIGRLLDLAAEFTRIKGLIPG